MVLILEDKGIQQSFGFMVNYVYLLDKVEQNNAEYLTKGTIAMTHPIHDSFQSVAEGANVQPLDDHGVSREKL
jgi:hypothetical protein